LAKRGVKVLLACRTGRGAFCPGKGGIISF